MLISSRQQAFLRWLTLGLLCLVCGCGGPEGIAVEPSLVNFVAISIPPAAEAADRHNSIRTFDKSAIREFLALLRDARETEDHKCAPWAHVRISQAKNGESFEIDLLPGHHDAYYEYRAGMRIYRVPREAMIKALKRMGVRDVLLAPAS